ncbi:Fic family protein [Methylovulum psychrotolerans]|nr:Fic family protein [Methylovulum psychrotolerans]
MTHPPLSAEQQAELTELKRRFMALAMTAAHSPVDYSALYPHTDDLTLLTAQLTDLQRCLESFRPLSPEQVVHLQEVFDTEYTYESNRIEGNTLTLMETDLIINKGLTVGGKNMQEHLEAVNHKQAIHYIRDIVHHQEDLTEDTLRKIHTLILAGIDFKNAGYWRTDRVRILGSRHVCPNPVKIPALMQDFFSFYQAHKNTLHPVLLAAEMHERLVTIHPFIDGNGRTARLVMNLILLKHGYPITIISSENHARHAYYKTLETAQLSDPKDNNAFVRLVAGYVKHWLLVYLDMLSGSIGEASHDKGYYFFKRIAVLL